MHLCAFCFFKWVDNLNLVISLCDSAELITCSRTSYILRASRDFRKSGLCSSWELQRKLCFFLNLVVSYLSYLSTCKKPIRFPNLQPFNLHHGIQMSFLGVTTQQLEQQVSPFHRLHRLFPETEKRTHTETVLLLSLALHHAPWNPNFQVPKWCHKISQIDVKR